MDNINVANSPYFFWIGAGEAKDRKFLDQFIIENAESEAVLVESRVEAVNSLKETFLRNSRTTIIEATVSSISESDVFYILNVGDFSSLKEPTGLMGLYPGMSVLDRLDVDTIRLVDVLSKFEVNPVLYNHLYIDLPLLTSYFLEDLISSGVLNYFKVLHISTSNEQLYEAAINREEVQEILTANGFLIMSVDMNDPDMPIVTFERNVLWNDFCKLKNKNECLIDEINKQKKESDTEIEASKLKIKELLIKLENKDVKSENLIKNLKEEIEESNKNNKELRERLSAFEKNKSEIEIENQELNYRQTKLDCEIVKVEAQLELIKDVVLREKRF